MQKSSLILVLSFILILSACAFQASETPGTATTIPTTASPQVVPASQTPPPSPTPTSTSLPPTETVAGRYPRVISSADLFNRVISIDPKNSQHLAYCAPGEIRVSQDGGQSWDSVPTAAAGNAAGEQGYQLFFGEPGAEDACLSASLDPQDPNTYYAVFTAAHEDFGAPPVFHLGLFTRDAGETWQLVEPPENATLEDFGGFWNLGPAGVQALFFPAGSWSQNPGAILVNELNQGAATWQPGQISCPEVGPCLRWGPAPSSIPGMGSPLPQSIFYSGDGGQNWSVIDPPAELRAPAPNQLVVLSDSEVLLISGGISLSTADETAPAVRRSLDAGLSWEPVNLPPLADDTLNPNYFPGLQYLSNHTYLSQGQEENTWYWLSPQLPIWCPVNTDRLPPYPVLLQNIGNQVWWVDQESWQAENIAISELTCAVE